ncbi:hypothetical protein [Cellulomonas sp. URHB0016]
MTKGSEAGGAGGGAVYGLGFIGAAVYYFQQADTFWLFALAIPKAFVWPAIVAYELLKSFYG